MKKLYYIFPIFFSVLVFLPLNGQTVTTYSQVIFDQNVKLNTAYKKTHGTKEKLELPKSLMHQFERIDAMFLSVWLGVGASAKEQYLKDIAAAQNMSENEAAIIYYAEEHPELFHYPKMQTGFGLELMLTDREDSLKCVQRYCKKKIKPRGIWSCVLFRKITTTPTLFHYRYPLPKKYYKFLNNEKELPTLTAYFRTSAKVKTTELDAKVVLTIKGIKK